ncbi:hypothetical protein Tco_0662060 [Tanacetum coccineum]
MAQPTSPKREFQDLQQKCQPSFKTPELPQSLTQPSKVDSPKKAVAGKQKQKGEKKLKTKPQEPGSSWAVGATRIEEELLANMLLAVLEG